MDVSGMTTEALTVLKRQVDAELACRARVADTEVSAIQNRIEELHGREIDATTVRHVLYANAELAESRDAI